MPRNILLAICLVFAVAAANGCSPERNPADKGAKAAAPRLHPAAARPEQAPPCTPEYLSCGLQTPVVSNGRRRFVNEEMGLSAIFPAGSRVCMNRSGDAARGFYAWYGIDEAGCPERGDLAGTYMGIGSSFNAAFHRSIREAAGGDCRPPVGRVGRLLLRAPLRIPGHHSLACQSPGQGEGIEILVYAMTGRWPRDFNEHAPRMIYWASLQTSPQRLARDLRMFRTFLSNLRIGIPN